MDQMQLAKARLYGAGAMDARNVKPFLGTAREVTAEQVATEINRSMSQIAAGDFDLVDLTDE